MTNEKPPDADRDQSDQEDDSALIPASAKPGNVNGCSPEVIEAARKEAEDVAVEIVRTHLSMWQGPLPSPEVFCEYPEGVQTHIINSAQDEGQHRRTIAKRGQIIAAALGFAAIGGAIICALNGQPWVGGVIAASFAVAIGIPVAINLLGR